MNNIDRLTEQVDKLIEKIKSLKHKFQDNDLEEESNSIKEEVIAGLENWLENVTIDSEFEEDDEGEED